MSNKYNPVLENQNERLREICEKQLKLKYGESADVKERLEWELQSIEKTGTAFIFHIFIQVIKSMGTVFYSFLNDYEVNYSLVAYLCGITKIDPVKFNLSPYFCYGYDGEKGVDFYLSVPSSKVEQVLECCEQLEGVLEVIDSYLDISDPKMENDQNCSVQTICDPNLYSVKIVTKWADKMQELVDLTGIIPDFNEFCESGAKDILNFKLGEFIKSDWCESRTDMLNDVDTKNIRQMLKIYRMTGANSEWIDACALLIQYDIATMNEIVAFGDDLYEQLCQYGVPDEKAFEIASSFDIEETLYSEAEYFRREYGVPRWYIKLCEKADLWVGSNRGELFEDILYDWISVWYKVHYPLEYYKVFPESREE